MTRILRKKPSQLPVLRRRLGLGAKEVLEAKRLSQMIQMMKFIFPFTPYSIENNKSPFFAYYYYLAIKYVKLVTIQQETLWGPLPKVPFRELRIDDVSDEISKESFRFYDQFELRRVFNALHFPQRLVASSGDVFSGEKVFLAGLFRLHYPNTFYDITWKDYFGLSPQSASKCVQLFLIFVYKHWSYLVFDHLEYWKPKIKSFSEKIRLKANSLGGHYPDNDHPNRFNIFAFIDSKPIQTTRPGGPLHSGRNSQRKPKHLQKTFYGGYQGYHGLKFQAVVLPNGLDLHVFVPLAIRHSDIKLFNESGVNDLISQLQSDVPETSQYRIYGDAGYEKKIASHLRTRNTSPHRLPPEQELENTVMKSLRESVEWSFSGIVRLFSFIDYPKNLKLFLSPIAEMFIVCVVLRNVYCCLHANETATFFHCRPPNLEHWMNEGPREVRP